MEGGRQVCSRTSKMVKGHPPPPSGVTDDSSRGKSIFLEGNFWANSGAQIVGSQTPPPLPPLEAKDPEIPCRPFLLKIPITPRVKPGEPQSKHVPHAPQGPQWYSSQCTGLVCSNPRFDVEEG